MAATECCSCLKYTWALQQGSINMHRWSQPLVTFSSSQHSCRRAIIHVSETCSLIFTEYTASISKCRHTKVFWYFKWKNKDASIYPPIYLTLLLQRLKGCLPGFFSPETWEWHVHRKANLILSTEEEELYPCEWKWQWRPVTFMTPAKDWELGNLRGQ